MFIFLAILALSGFISVLFAGFLYYGIGGLIELAEVMVIITTVTLYWLWNRFGGGAKVAARERKERYDTNRRRFEAMDIRMDDGSIRAHGTFEYDEYGIPILD